MPAPLPTPTEVPAGLAERVQAHAVGWAPSEAAAAVITRGAGGRLLERLAGVIDDHPDQGWAAVYWDPAVDLAGDEAWPVTERHLVEIAASFAGRLSISLWHHLTGLDPADVGVVLGAVAHLLVNTAIGPRPPVGPAGAVRATADVADRTAGSGGAR